MEGDGEEGRKGGRGGRENRLMKGRMWGMVWCGAML